MAMGSTGTINISAKMLTDIKQAVTDYKAKTDALKTQLDGEVTGLVGTGFVGEAANGFKDFYTNNIVPVVNEEGLGKLLDAIDQIADSTLQALPGAQGVDEQLASGNRSGGGEG